MVLAKIFFHVSGRMMYISTIHLVQVICFCSTGIIRSNRQNVLSRPESITWTWTSTAIFLVITKFDSSFKALSLSSKCVNQNRSGCFSCVLNWKLIFLLQQRWWYLFGHPQRQVVPCFDPFQSSLTILYINSSKFSKKCKFHANVFFWKRENFV